MNNGINYEKASQTLDEIEKIENSLCLDLDTRKRVEKLINEIEEDKFEDNYKRGKALEVLIENIIEGTNIFKCISNKNTSSNEFDILVQLNIKGKVFRKNDLIPKWIPDKFLIECKNYNKPIEVGLLGKFFCLMEQSNINFGIFISRVGVSGKRDQKNELEKFWKYGMALINKINLKYNGKKNFIDLELNDLKCLIQEGSNIIEILECRKNQIDLDVNNSISEWIKPHELVSFNEEY